MVLRADRKCGRQVVRSPRPRLWRQNETGRGRSAARAVPEACRLSLRQDDAAVVERAPAAGVSAPVSPQSDGNLVAYEPKDSMRNAIVFCMLLAASASAQPVDGSITCTSPVSVQDSAKSLMQRYGDEAAIGDKLSTGVEDITYQGVVLMP